MKLNYIGLQDPTPWAEANITLPSFDWPAMVEATATAPNWVHFGSGNLFRGYIARLHHDLLEKGGTKAGIIACDSSAGYDLYESVFVPHDAMTLLVALKGEGTIEKSVIASLGMGVRANPAFGADFDKLKTAFANPSLQMVSYTITEKGYTLHDLDGAVLPKFQEDFAAGPDHCTQVMSVSTALLWERFKTCGAPIAMVSMDNCSHNGDKLRASLIGVAEAWLSGGFVTQDFLVWLKDTKHVACPWSMIDKITPRSAENLADMLTQQGVEDMGLIPTKNGRIIASFVNAEVPELLVIEDDFPNGHPPLEDVGVFFTSRETVNNSERMKVTTCLNPLHTALAIYGCMLGYDRISAEMCDPQLKALVETIGYQESMKVVVDPKIIDPKAFIKEVLEERFPNPFVPEDPHRIATDTSQKIAIRFGETLKSYVAHPDLNPADLTFIPLVLAGYLRYLLALDDDGNPFACSDDPMLESLQAQLSGIVFGDPTTVGDKLRPILANTNLFGLDIIEIGLADKIEAMFAKLIAGPGAIRGTLIEYLG